MKTPKRLQPLVDDGLIDEVLTQLMSGKEASQVYVVRCGEEVRPVPRYLKRQNSADFEQAVQYQEGRKERNTQALPGPWRRRPAMVKKSRSRRG